MALFGSLMKENLDSNHSPPTCKQENENEKKKRERERDRNNENLTS